MTPLLTTERLYLRVATDKDLGAVLEFFRSNRDFLEPYEPPRPDGFYSERFWREQLSRHRRAFEAGTAILLFMFAKEASSRVVGQLSFTGIVRGAAQMCYLGYALAEAEQGKGYMTEALREAIRYMFEEQNLHRIMANFMPTNQRSNNVLRRLGFAIEGYARDYLLIKGEWRDHVLSSITNPSWQPED
ncbi:MAG: 30S ribosomal protein S5 alanine N-acetyltransferase [Chloroflexi bacterium]|nr:MAG: 30S ribosomal protein S5 alanine N-acetyltransferase [Chloroflexota bacterium]